MYRYASDASGVAVREGGVVATPFEYSGNCDSCIGCAETIHAGDTVVLLSEDRPERLLCVACWWLMECDLPLPAWAPRAAAPAHVNLAGVFAPVPQRERRSA